MVSNAVGSTCFLAWSANSCYKRIKHVINKITAVNQVFFV